MARILITAVLITLLFRKQQSTEVNESCICVPTTQCRGLNDGADILGFQQAINPDIECGNLSETCCHKDHVIKVMQNSDEDDDCVCVPFKNCRGFTEGQNVLSFRQMTDPDIECENLLQTCCDRDDVILPNTNDCGYRNYNDTIFPVENTDLESQFAEFPWMIEISSKKSINDTEYTYIAGGSLIHPLVILTAGHKVADKNPSLLRVRAGEWNRNSVDEPYAHQDRAIDKIIIHENFNRSRGYNGIALLFLDTPMNIERHVNTICLPPQNFNFSENTRCFVVGWGTDALNNNTNTDILKKVDIPLVSDSNCEKFLIEAGRGLNFKLHRSFLCAGGELGKDACYGDGGSPLVCPISTHENRYYQAGIVSWGIGCGMKNVPTVYVKVPEFHDWIMSKLPTN